MSLEHYQSQMETMHLLSSPSNVRHPSTSIAQYRSGKAVKRKLVNVWAVIGAIRFTQAAWDDYAHWQTQKHKTLKRVNQLVEAVVRKRFVRIGRLSPYWAAYLATGHGA